MKKQRKKSKEERANMALRFSGLLIVSRIEGEERSSLIQPMKQEQQSAIVEKQQKQGKRPLLNWFSHCFAELMGGLRGAAKERQQTLSPDIFLYGLRSTGSVVGKRISQFQSFLQLFPRQWIASCLHGPLLVFFPFYLLSFLFF